MIKPSPWYIDDNENSYEKNFYDSDDDDCDEDVVEGTPLEDSCYEQNNTSITTSNKNIKEIDPEYLNKEIFIQQEKKNQIMVKKREYCQSKAVTNMQE